MCGICGVIGVQKNKGEEYIDSMLEKFFHRGPDSEGKYSDKKACLGVRRLSIIDLDTGQQPIYSEDNKMVLVFNGEIYNYPQLRARLISDGHRFKTSSDTEVIIHLYQRYGEKCLDLLKGMFSFAIWDKERETLFAVRDRFGIKPLYYYYGKGVFCFSSELRAMLRLPFIDKNIDKQAMGLYFSLEYVPSPHCIIEGVRKLSPAHYITYKDGTLTEKRYWDLYGRKENLSISAREASEKAYALMRGAVKQHMVSDVPIGVFLSGGVDSTALAYMVSSESPAKTRSFTVGFEEDTFDETGYARLAAEKIGTEHHEYIFTLKEFIKGYDGAQNLFDEPFADISIFPSYMLAVMSRKEIKVALSGEGADELFMGYPTYMAHKYYAYINALPEKVKSAFYLFINMMPTSFKYLTIDYKLRKFFEGLREKDPLKRHLEWMGAFMPADLEKMFLPDNRPGTDLLGAYARGTLKVPSMSGLYKQIQYLDIYSYLSEDLLVKADRSSMAASLELRVPYLDHELVEFIWSLDPGLLYGKHLMKKIFKGRIPRRIINRRKKGFAIPFSVWLSDKGFLERVRPYFDKKYINGQRIFDHAYVAKMLEDHLTRKKNNRKKLRTYIMFQRWYESVLPRIY